MMNSICRIASFVLAATLVGQAQTSTRQLQVIYQNNDFQVTGISVSKTGCLFVNFPRRSPEYLNAGTSL